MNKMKVDDYMNNDPTCVQGVSSLVTWFIHSGKTQIHVASGDVREPCFDIVIIPVNSDLVGCDIDNPNTKRSYGYLMPHATKTVVAGDVVMTKQKKDWKSEKVAIAVISNTKSTSSSPDISMNNAVRDVLREGKTGQHGTVGIQISNPISNDCTEFICMLLDYKKNDRREYMSVFFCTSQAPTEMNECVKRFDALIQDTKLPRRLLSPKMRGLFPRLKIRTKIQKGSLLDSGCQSVVAGIGQDLNWNNGAVTKLIANAAGSNCQNYLKSIKGRIEYWQIIRCPAGKLCDKEIKFLFFGCIPIWKKQQNTDQMPKLLANFILGCLLKADEGGCKSVAIPLLGTGRLNYPERAVLASILDGIELYAQLATLGKIEKIVIAIHSIDNDSLQMYVSELNRRGNKSTKSLCKEPGAVVLRSTGGIFALTVVKAQDLQEKLPIECVNLIINDKPGQDIDFNYRIDVGKLMLDIDLSKQTFEDVVQLIIQQCETNKITALVVNIPCIPTIPAERQIEEIIDAFATINHKVHVYLYKVLLAVSNEDDFKKCQNDLRQKNSVHGGPKWKQDKGHFNDDVFIINGSDSDTMEDVNKGSLNHDDAMDVYKPMTDHGDMTEVTEDSQTYDDVTNTTCNKDSTEHDDVTEVTKHIPNNDDVTDVTKELVMDTVTAEVNTSITQYLRSTSKVDIWKQTIKTVFNVSVLDTNGTMLLEGTLDNILRVEVYLENDFPNDPKLVDVHLTSDQQIDIPLSNDGMVTVSNDAVNVEKKTIKVCKRSEKPPIYQRKTGREDNQRSTVTSSTNDGVTSMTTPKTHSPVITTAVRQKNTTRETMNTWVQKTNPQDTNISFKNKPYKFNMLYVYVYQKDITTVPTDTLVCTDDSSFQHNIGLSKHISSKAGKGCVDEWLKCSSPEKLPDCLCIPTSAGQLHYGIIIHVIRPRELGTIHKAFHNVLLSCEDNKRTSVAIPTIGAGTWPAQVQDCAEQYYQALQAFCRSTASKTSLSEIHIVDRHESTVLMVRSIFDRRFNAVPKDPISASSADDADDALDISTFEVIDKVSTQSVQTKTTNETTDNKLQQGWDDPLRNDPQQDTPSTVSRNDGAIAVATPKYGPFVKTNTEIDKQIKKQTEAIDKPANLCTNHVADNFYTDKGVLYRINKVAVYVYQKDITIVPTESLVCTDDILFKHKFGLSCKIASKAGKHCVQHWLQIPSQNKLEQCMCIVTPAGDLNYSSIIHVIRPIERNAIQKAFTSVLLQCDNSKISSVAIPTIGAGTWKNNVHDCADQYYRALQAYGGSMTFKTSLSEIHIVDKDKSTVDTVRSVFDRRCSTVPTELVSGPADYVPFSVFSSTVAVTKQGMFSFKADIKVLTFNDTFSDEVGCVEQALDRCIMFKSWFNVQKRTMHECSEIRWTEASDSLYCNYVIVAVRPWIPDPSDQNSMAEFKCDVQKAVKNIMFRVKQMKNTSVAIPMMIHSDNRDVNNACCDAMVKEIISAAQISDLTVHLVTGDANYDRFCSVLTDLIYGKTHAMRESAV